MAVYSMVLKIRAVSTVVFLTGLFETEVILMGSFSKRDVLTGLLI